MVRAGRARHERPRGRRALTEAYTALQVDLAYLRSDRFADHLKLAELTAQADALSAALASQARGFAQAQAATQAQLQQALAALSVLREEMSVLISRTEAQDAMLTRLLVMVEQAYRADGGGSAPGPLVDVQAQADPAPHDPPGESSPELVDLAAAPAPQPELEPVFAAVGALRVPEHTSAPSPAQSRPVATIADSAIDDETVRRLRLIREGYGA